MGDQASRKARDPAAKKRKDLLRQRKIVSNGSDKAARKHEPAIKAAANRKIRRNDRQHLDRDTDGSANEIATSHRTKNRHWGSIIAADHRKSAGASQAYYRKVGGRKVDQLNYWRAAMEAETSPFDKEFVKSQIQRLESAIEAKGQK